MVDGWLTSPRHQPSRAVMTASWFSGDSRHFVAGASGSRRPLQRVGRIMSLLLRRPAVLAGAHARGSRRSPITSQVPAVWGSGILADLQTTVRTPTLPSDGESSNRGCRAPASRLTSRRARRADNAARRRLRESLQGSAGRGQASRASVAAEDAVPNGELAWLLPARCARRRTQGDSDQLHAASALPVRVAGYESPFCRFHWRWMVGGRVGAGNLRRHGVLAVAQRHTPLERPARVKDLQFLQRSEASTRLRLRRVRDLEGRAASRRWFA